MAMTLKDNVMAGYAHSAYQDGQIELANFWQLERLIVALKSTSWQLKIMNEDREVA
jgi:hypothetical protein